MTAMTTTPLPGLSRAGHYLYVVQFNSDTVKIGRTMNPATRLKSHATAGRPHGISVVSQWLSQPHWLARPNENKLTTFCNLRYISLNDGEFYADADPEEIVAFGESLSTSSTSEETLRFQRYGRHAGKGGSWPQDDPVVVVSLPRELLHLLDADRGSRSRAEWLKGLAETHLSSLKGKRGAAPHPGTRH